MVLNRRFPLRLVIVYALRLAGVAAAWAVVVWAAYTYFGWTFLRIPFLPIATVGTAVAFYVGFKNNAAYERFWEGRKIWGGIVNASRTWATAVVSYVEPHDDGERAQATRRELIYRHMAWINALRLQLRKSSRFFHKPARTTKIRLEKHADAMRNDWDEELAPFLDEDELAGTADEKNPATHMLTRQGKLLAGLLAEERLDLFHQIDLMKIIEELYTLQGKCERIKNTPFPRQYAEYSRIFTRVFAVLVPFGLIDVFASHADKAETTLQSMAPVVGMIMSSSLVTWVFTTMEGIGDSSEDPFERSMNDVPMSALCRTIEIDLRQILGETELPPKEEAVDGILY